MNEIMEGFDKAIVSLIPAHSRKNYRAMRAAQDQRERELIEKMRAELTDALADIAQAMRYPRTSTGRIGSAIACLLRAREAAQELDPPSAA